MKKITTVFGIGAMVLSLGLGSAYSQQTLSTETAAPKAKQEAPAPVEKAPKSLDAKKDLTTPAPSKAPAVKHDEKDSALKGVAPEVKSDKVVKADESKKKSGDEAANPTPSTTKPADKTEKSAPVKAGSEKKVEEPKPSTTKQQ